MHVMYVRRVVLAVALIACFVYAPTAQACEQAQAFGNQWSAAGQLDSPGDVATDSAGNTWVLDTAHNRVQKFDSEGEFVLQFGSSGSGNGQFSGPKGIAVDPEGDVWVASGPAGSTRVQEFSGAGVFQREWSAGESPSLTGIAVDPEGNVWVSATTASGSITKIKKFTPAGASLLEFGSPGTGNGQFKEPQGIAADSEGNVLVADTGNHRIQEFNGAGEFVRKYGSEGTGNGQLKFPSDVAVDSEGRVWVIDTGNNRAQRFTSKGTYQTQFGTGGPNDGQLNGPQGIAVDAGGDIWIADTENDRVAAWAGC